jgi:trimethylamine---corrinoid protein Co-methyltransferase
MFDPRGTRFFSDDEIEKLREKVFELLSVKGVTMDHPPVLKLLSDAGAQVDFSTKQVRFPRQLVEDALKRTPKNIVLAGTESSYDLKVPREDGTFHLRTGTGARCYLDPQTGAYRGTTIDDVAQWARLAGQLDHVSFPAFPFPTDVPVDTADVYALRTMLRNSPKHIWVQPYSARSVEYLIEMALVAAGSEDALKTRPLASFIACSLTPLEFKFMDLEIIMQCARRGIPLHACSLPSAGGTAPITIPSVILLSSAEIVAMVTTAQIIQSGSPIVATPLIFTMDMQTGRSLQSSPEALRGAGQAMYFIKSAFGIPAHTYGSGADSPDIDGQSMAERALLGAIVAMAGADIMGGAGQVEVATTISPLQLIIDNEIAAMIRTIMSGPEVNEETMAWNDLLASSGVGHFLETEHTLRHCRSVFRPRTFYRQTREIWTNQGKKDLMTRTKEIYNVLSEKAKERELPQDLARELDRIVEAADSNLKR